MFYKKLWDTLRITPTCACKTVSEFLNLWHLGDHPSYAGITKDKKDNLLTLKDHPRLRGYYEIPRDEEVIEMGSPPLTRVLPHIIVIGLAESGITPAYAGITMY